MFPTNLLLFCLSFKLILCSKELENFMKTLNDAKSDLRWIRAMTGHELDYPEDEEVEGGIRYKRSSTGLDDLLASFNVINYYAEDEVPEILNEIDGGDAWYSSFRSKECKNGGCTQRTLKDSKNAKKKRKHNKGKSKKRLKQDKSDNSDDDSEKDDEFEEQDEGKPFEANRKDPEYDEYDSSKDGSHRNDNFDNREKYEQKNYKDKNARKLKSGNQKLSHSFSGHNHKEYGNQKQRQSNEVSKEVSYDSMFDSFQSKPLDDPQSDRIELKDQVEKTQNDLSHEANYKLSKIEQEAMDKKTRANRSWSLKHPDFQIPMLTEKRVPDEAPFKTSKLIEKRLASKRALDPLNEFKLKVSERLMLKGFGASLPSDAIDDRRIHDLNLSNELDNKKRDASSNNLEQYEWNRAPDVKIKDESFKTEDTDHNSQGVENVENKESTGRKLLSSNDYDLPDELNHEETNKNDNENQRSKLHTQKFSKRAFIPPATSVDKLTPYYNSNYYNKIIKNEQKTENENNKKTEKRSSDVSEDDDSLTLDFSEDLVKDKDISSCGDSSKYVQAGSKLKNSSASAEAATLSSATYTLAPTTASKARNNTKSKFPSDQMTFKLNIAFNATVLNCTKNQSNSNTSKIQIPAKKRTSKNADNRHLTEEVNDARIVEKRNIIFPPLPSEIRKRTNEAISKSIEKSKEESPIDGLLNGKLSAQLVNAVFRLVKTNENFREYILPGLKSRKLKACTGCNDLNAITNDKNRDDINRSEEMLRQAMETISAIIEQQVRSRTCVPLCKKLKEFYDLILASRNENEKDIREVKKLKARERVERSHYLTKRETSPEPKVRQKYSVVKKLLNQYGYLPAEDQEKSKDIKDMLQMHLVYLKDLEMQEIKRRKRAYFANSFLNRKSNVESHDTDADEISPRFIKLVKISEVIRRSSLLPENVDYTMLQDSDYL